MEYLEKDDTRSLLWHIVKMQNDAYFLSPEARRGCSLTNARRMCCVSLGINRRKPKPKQRVLNPRLKAMGICDDGCVRLFLVIWGIWLNMAPGHGLPWGGVRNTRLAAKNIILALTWTSYTPIEPLYNPNIAVSMLLSIIPINPCITNLILNPLLTVG